jgi:hypothetical protein
MNPNYAARLRDADLRRFDWTQARQLRGAALMLWWVFTSDRVPYRSVIGSTEDLEMVEVALTPKHCHALGVTAGADKDRRRTLNEAGERVCAVDHAFRTFEAYGGHGKPSVLRIVRERCGSSLARPYDGAPPQLELVVS